MDEAESNHQSSSRRKFQKAKKASKNPLGQRIAGSYTRKWKEHVAAMAAIKNIQTNKQEVVLENFKEEPGGNIAKLLQIWGLQLAQRKGCGEEAEACVMCIYSV
jgi:hypothetical protein